MKKEFPPRRRDLLISDFSPLRSQTLNFHVEERCHFFFLLFFFEVESEMTISVIVIVALTADKGRPGDEAQVHRYVI